MMLTIILIQATDAFFHLATFQKNKLQNTRQMKNRLQQQLAAS